MYSLYRILIETDNAIFVARIDTNKLQRDATNIRFKKTETASEKKIEKLSSGARKYLGHRHLIIQDNSSM